MAGIDVYLTRDGTQPLFLWIASHQPHMPRDHGDASAYPPDRAR